MPHVPCTFRLHIRLGCAVAALAVAYACDARTPTAPAPALTPVSLRGDESEGALLGSIDLAPSSGLSQFAAVPAFKWALVRVTGKWDVRPNPACGDQPPEWRCSTNDAYSSFAPAPDAFAGPVRVAMFRDGTLDEWLLLRAFGSPDAGVGLTQREIARSVSAAPALLNPTVQRYGNTGESVASYIIEGSYTVTVTEIASPIRVTESAAEADGTRTYTVEPLYGLQYINPSGWTPSSDPPGALRWYFVPGENVDPAAPNSDPPWTINECRNQTTCRWQPPGPGRVQVAAFVETRRARARNEDDPCQVRIAATTADGGCGGEEAPRVQVTCGSPTGGSPHRGGPVVCRTTVSPAMPFAVTSRTAQARNLTVWDSVRHEHGTGETDEWAGTAVVETRVAIDVEVTPTGGQPQTLRGTARFDVTRRSWSVYEIVAPAVIHRIREGQMGMIPGRPTYGVFNLDTILIRLAGVDSVSAGPNAGAVYFTSQPQFKGSVGIIHLHPALYPPYPAVYEPWPPGLARDIWGRWYSDQNGNAGPNWNQPYPPCSQNQLQQLRLEAERHEGVTLASNSHVGLANQIFRSSKLHDRFEEFYRSNVSKAAFQFAAAGVYNTWWQNDYWPPQHNFDTGPNNDTNLTWAAIGCLPDNDLKAP